MNLNLHTGFWTCTQDLAVGDSDGQAFSLACPEFRQAKLHNWKDCRQMEGWHFRKSFVHQCELPLCLGLSSDYPKTFVHISGNCLNCFTKRKGTILAFEGTSGLWGSRCWALGIYRILCVLSWLTKLPPHIQGQQKHVTQGCFLQ